MSIIGHVKVQNSLFVIGIHFSGVVDFVKAGFHMRRAWKMYEKCQNELKSSSDGAGYMNGNREERKNSLMGTPKKV